MLQPTSSIREAYCGAVLQGHVALVHDPSAGYCCAGLAELKTISCASCTGFAPAAVQALASMHRLVELNLRGLMPLATVHCLTALQALTGLLSFLRTVLHCRWRQRLYAVVQAF